jgi:uncharacterized SAM-binding protein YcdF (DUF218 family)
MESGWLFARKVIEQLIFPPGLFLLLILIIILLFLSKRKKIALWLTFIFIIFGYIFSSWLGEWLLLRPLENSTIPLKHQNELIEKDKLDEYAMIILTGGMVEGSPAAGAYNAEIGEISLARLYGGFKIYQDYPVDIFVSGGMTLGKRDTFSIARVMKEVLVSWGIDPDKILLEENSRTTLENAVYTLDKLAEKKYRGMILVTSALHMKRSLQLFQNQEMEVIPAPVNYIFEENPYFITFFPNIFSFEHNVRALHEWIGILYYRLGLK